MKTLTMNMPAFNVNNPITKDQIVKSDLGSVVHDSINNTDKIKQNLSAILSVKEIKNAAEKLSKI